MVDNKRIEKQKRKQFILNLIKTNKIKTQSELVKNIKQAGFEATQATVSRDIKELDLIKIQEKDGSFCYVVRSDKPVSKEETKRMLVVFFEAVTDILAANNLVIIKTLPGMAPAVGTAIDCLKDADILGSIAGDDNLFVATISQAKATEVKQKLEELLKEA